MHIQSESDSWDRGKWLPEMKDEETLTEKLFEWLMFLQSYRVRYTIHEVLIKVQYWIKRLSGHIIHMSCSSKQQQKKLITHLGWR